MDFRGQAYHRNDADCDLAHSGWERRVLMDRAKARAIAMRCAVVIVAIGMLAYIIHYSLGQFSTTLTTLPTQEITDYTLLGAEVYLFRDERVIWGESFAPVLYTYRDGERVPKDATYAVAYPRVGASAAEIAALQEQLDSIEAQIALLEDSDRAGSLITSLRDNQEAITQSFYRVLENIAAGGYLGAQSESQTLLSHISTHGMLTGQQNAKDMIAALEEQRQMLLQAWGGTEVTYVSPYGTNFVHDCDGYESVFDYALVETMTASDFRAMTEASPASTQGAVGKMINSHVWYAAMPMNEDNAARFEVGGTYTFTFIDNDGTELPLHLVRKLDGQGKEDDVLIFSCDRTPKNFSFLRTQRVQSVVEQVTGYRVPVEALREHNGEKGVYVLSDSSVEFRRITIVRQGSGYYIVQTAEQDAAGGAGMAKYLQYGDLIITAGRDLYIGKMYG